MAAFLMVLAVWLDYWLRGEIGIVKKFVAFLNGQWGTGVLIGGGIFYALLLRLTVCWIIFPATGNFAKTASELFCPNIAI
jgi:hypothetical protein